MNDPNDSDGSWEFVDKDSDSDTSSVAAPYDTGLPDENLSSNLNDNLEGNAWNNNDDEFITDSDIEACAEETAESEGDEETVQQEPLEELSEPNASDEQDKQDETQAESTDEVTRSMLNYDDVDDDDTEPKEENSQLVETGEELQVVQEEETQVEKAEHSTSDQEEDNDDDITITQEAVDTETQPDVIIGDKVEHNESEEIESISKSIESSDSDFEKLDSVEDLEVREVASDPGATKPSEPQVDATEPAMPLSDVTDPKMSPSTEFNDTAMGSGNYSDTGSSDFTVISAPSSPPVEILSQQMMTSTVADDVPSEATNQKTVDMATEPMPANQRTVGMVTDHVTWHNQRFLISMIMISFGVGILLGRFPPQQIQVMEQRSTPRLAMRADKYYKEMSEEYVHRHETRPLGEQEMLKPRLEAAIETMKKLQARNDVLRMQLTNENLKLKSQNRGLRNTIQELREETEKFSTEREMNKKMQDDATRVFRLMQDSCTRQSQENRIEINNKNKELEQLKGHLTTVENDNVFLNRSMVLYRRLQDQHHTLLALYREKMKTHRAEEMQNSERQEFLTEQMLKCNRELKTAAANLARADEGKKELQKQLEQYESNKNSQDTVCPPPANPTLQFSGPSETMSPLLQALADERDGTTCPSGSKFRTLAARLNVEVKDQRSLIRKLSGDNQLQVVALESLYNSNRELSDYAACLREQVQLSPQDRTRDPVSFCSEGTQHTEKPPLATEASTPHPGPTCVFSVNGTLAEDLSILNLSVKVNERSITGYTLKIFRPPSTVQYYFNATPIISDLKAPKPDPSTPNRDCALSEAPIFKKNITQDPFSPRDAPQFVPALWYSHAVASGARVRHLLTESATRLRFLKQVCDAKEKSLNVSREQVKKATTQLAIFRRDLIVLQKENRELCQKVENTTKELEQKPTIKQCFESAFNTEEILKKINRTKTYKVAAKMTQKVKKMSKKAWKKFTKLIEKFKPRQDVSEWRDDEDYLKDYYQEKSSFHGKAGKGKERKRGKKGRIEKYEMKKQHKHKKSRSDDDEHEESKKFRRKTEKQEKGKRRTIGPQFQLKDRKQRKWQTGKNHHESKDDDEHHFRKYKTEQRKNRKIEKQGRMKKREDEKKSEKLKKWEETLEKRNRNNHEKKENQRFSSKEKQNYEEKFNEAETPSRKHEKKGRNYEKKEKKDKHERQNFQKYQDKIQEEFNEFHDLFSATYEEAKKRTAEAGRRVVNQLAPVYEGFKDVYCNADSNIIPESMRNLWCPREDKVEKQKVNEESKSEEDKEQHSNVFHRMAWGNDLYQNITDLLSPILELSNLVELPAFGTDWEEMELVSPSSKEEAERKTASSHLDAQDSLDSDQKKKSAEDPQWFDKMFKAREDLRKAGEELEPLSDEEFDWYLKLFESRDKMRKSGENLYPAFRDSKEMDWFLKMFEARARLRFEQGGSGNEKNWYLKMSEARDKARSQEPKVTQGSEGTEGSKVSDDWYTQMFEARENLRFDDSGHWYQDTTKARENARGQGTDGYWFLRRMKSRERERKSCQRMRRKSRSCGRMVSSLNEREENLEKTEKNIKSKRTIIR